MKTSEVKTLKVNTGDDVVETTKDSLKRAKKMAKLLIKQMAIVADLAEQLDAASKIQTRMELEDLPTLMNEVGLADFSLKTGHKVVIKKDNKASITKANQPKAFAWLRKGGFGGMIKTQVAADFEADNKESAEKLEAQLIKRLGEDNVLMKESVHHSTLKSFVNEQLEKGKKLPAAFSVFPFEKAIVTKTKRK